LLKRAAPLPLEIPRRREVTAVRDRMRQEVEAVKQLKAALNGTNSMDIEKVLSR